MSWIAVENVFNQAFLTLFSIPNHKPNSFCFKISILFCIGFRKLKMYPWSAIVEYPYLFTVMLCCPTSWFIDWCTSTGYRFLFLATKCHVKKQMMYLLLFTLNNLTWYFILEYIFNITSNQIGSYLFYPYIIHLSFFHLLFF